MVTSLKDLKRIFLVGFFRIFFLFILVLIKRKSSNSLAPAGKISPWRIPPQQKLTFQFCFFFLNTKFPKQELMWGFFCGKIKKKWNKN